MLGFYQACRTTFELMEPDRDYLIEENIWAEVVAQYQKTYSSSYNPLRSDYPLRKTGTNLKIAGKQVWAFSPSTASSSALTLALAFSFSLSLALALAHAFAFAFTLAFAAGNLEGLPKPNPESAQNLQHIWSEVKPADFGLAAEQGRIWLEARQEKAGTFQVAIGGISEDGLARIADILRAEAK